MGKYFASEKKISKTDNKKKADAKRSLNNYINQLKIHFDLHDEEVVNILDMVLKSKRNNCSVKKWWHVWR